MCFYDYEKYKRLQTGVSDPWLRLCGVLTASCDQGGSKCMERHYYVGWGKSTITLEIISFNFNTYLNS